MSSIKNVERFNQPTILSRFPTLNLHDDYTVMSKVIKRLLRIIGQEYLNIQIIHAVDELLNILPLESVSMSVINPIQKVTPFEVERGLDKGYVLL